MPRYFLQLSFNGTNYHGWQLQENAHTVQAEINKALSTLLKHEAETAGCGRTDTGVHARTFFAHFETPKAIENGADFLHHLNCILPKDIAVQRLIEVEATQHARFAAVLRTYEYHIHQKKNPFLNDSSYFFPFDIDFDKMNRAARLLIGQQDFAAFSKSRTQVNHYHCNIEEALWCKADSKPVNGETPDNTYYFTITADRFLRSMVRSIVGTLLEVGEGKISEDDFKNIIEGKSRREAGIAVPAHGLYLVNVLYPFLHSDFIEFGNKD